MYFMILPPPNLFKNMFSGFRSRTDLHVPWRSERYIYIEILVSNDQELTNGRIVVSAFELRRLLYLFLRSFTVT